MEKITFSSSLPTADSSWLTRRLRSLQVEAAVNKSQDRRLSWPVRWAFAAFVLLSLDNFFFVAAILCLAESITSVRVDNKSLRIINLCFSALCVLTAKFV